MAKKNSSVSLEEVKGLISEDQDFLKSVLRQAVRDILEAEMSEALQATKSERCDGRLGYPAIMGVVWLPVLAKLNCVCPRIGKGAFRRKFLNDTSVARKRW